MTITAWLATLYSIAGVCAMSAAAVAFVEIGRAAKLVRDLDQDPFAGDELHQMIDTGWYGERKVHVAKTPTILRSLLGHRTERVVIGVLVVVGILAGTAADILGAVK